MSQAGLDHRRRSSEPERDAPSAVHPPPEEQSMSDEFDDVVDPVALPTRPSPAGQRAPRLLARLYASANQTLRLRLVDCLVRPLGPLALAGVAAGAFSAVVVRSGAGGIAIAIGDVARFSKEQVAELAHFVEQVSPDALAQAAQLVADNPLGVGAFTAAVAVLLALEASRAGASTRRARRNQAAAPT
jgi:hypothetical protein